MDTDSDAALQPQSLGDLLSEVVSQLPPQPDQRRVPTGFTDLDAVTGGLAPGSLWVISGRGGAGKSVLVSDLVRSAAVRHGQPTLLITRREPAVHVARRLLAGEARVPLQHLDSGLQGDETARLGSTTETLGIAPLLVVRSEDVDVNAIRWHLASQEVARPTALLVVDDVPAGSEQLPVLRELGELAAAQQMAVVAVAQEDVPNAERQRRQIEQIADVALTVHRDDQEDPASPRLGEADFILTRHRHGPVATIVVHFQGHYGRFMDSWAAAPGR